MTEEKNRVCPVERAGGLDNIFRKLVHNPQKILGEYVKEGMVVLDFGCGPGLFSIEMAKMVGNSGKVIAADLQQGMLDKLKAKIRGTELEKIIHLHRSQENEIGFSEKVDFALAFYVIHELTDQKNFFAKLKSILKPEGKLLIIEPSLRVSKEAFAKTIKKALATGFKNIKEPKIFLSRSALVQTKPSNQ